jgi:hypothetical protein
MFVLQLSNDSFPLTLFCLFSCIKVANDFIIVKDLRVFVYLFIYGGTGVRTQGFTLAKQVRYRLSHTSSPLCSGYFGDGVSLIIPIASSQVPRITDVSHQCLARQNFKYQQIKDAITCACIVYMRPYS